MISLKELIKKIVKNNKDIVAMYRTQIYLSKSIFVKIKLFRYIILLKIFLEKHLLKKDISKKRDKLLNNIPYYPENNISKRRKLTTALKSVVEKEVIFIDALDVIINTSIYKEQISNYMEERKIEDLPTNLFEINLYGKMICDVLEENHKDVYLLLDEKEISKELVKNILEQNQINYKDIIYYSDNIEERNNELLKIINDRFRTNTKFVYIGEFFKEEISDEQKDLMIIVYENCRFWGEKFRPDNDNSIQMSIYSSMINNKLHEGMHTYTRAYEFGYCYGGIISYYILTQMIKNNTTFIIEFTKLKNKLLNKFKNNEIIDAILNLTFPKVVNNFVYDGTENRDNIELNDVYFKKQKSIQQGVIDFSKQYEEKLMQIINTNNIEYIQVEDIFEFLLKNTKNTKKMLKECY